MLVCWCCARIFLFIDYFSFHHISTAYKQQLTMELNSPLTPRKCTADRAAGSLTPTKSASHQKRVLSGSFEETTSTPFTNPNLTNLTPLKSPTGTCKADRFIPNRAEMDFDYCNHFLNKNDLDENGRPTEPSVSKKQKYAHSILSGSFDYSSSDVEPKRLIGCFDRKKPLQSLDDVRSLLKQSFGDRTAAGIVQCHSPQKNKQRCIPNGPSRILDAPEIMDDYYLNLLAWGPNNKIAVALHQSLYLWNACDGSVDELTTLEGAEDYITSVSWSQKDNHLAIGTSANTVQIWDVGRSTKLRDLAGHTARVSALSWCGHTLSSGGRDSTIFNHDVRQSHHITSAYVGHQQEVCGLTWSHDGSTLASGGNENMLCLFDAAMSANQSGTGSARSSSLLMGAATHSPRHIIRDHLAAVKALAWCPWQRNTLASGGGTADKTIRIWNTADGSNLKCTDTGSQVCALQWSDTYKELVSSHGFSDNQLILWKYPTMTKVREFRGHTSRVLHLAKSPDGTTLCSASADETIRFWELFGSSTSSSISMNARGSSSSSSSSGSGRKRDFEGTPLRSVGLSLR